MNDDVTTDKLFEDLQAVVRDAEALLQATASHAGEKVQAARAKAEESLRQARGRIDEIENDALYRAKAMLGAAEGYVKEKPWQALGVAAGVGVVIGLLLGRR